jgi:hypothetical protein
MYSFLAGPLHPFLSVTADIAQRRRGPKAVPRSHGQLLNRAKADLGAYYHFGLWPGVQ